MESRVNFETLKTMTDGDIEFEKNLLAAFLTSAEECLDKLNAAIVTDDETLWRQQAHALKGNCYILGADMLGGLCATAQADWRADSKDKESMFKEIKSEFEAVRIAVDEHQKNLC